MVVIPDTQSYVDHSQNVFILNNMMDWIVADHERLDIALVLQEGDLVFQNGARLGTMVTGDQGSRQQWRNVSTAFHRLDGVVPYILALGNHDYGTTCAESRYTHFNEHFKPGGYHLTEPLFGGILAAMGPNAYGNRTLENAAYDFKAPDGRRLLVLSLEMGPRQAAVDWAKQTTNQAKYRDYTKLLLTHTYLYADGTRYDWASKGESQSNNPHSYKGIADDVHDGEELWNELVRVTPGMEMVFCGHVGGDMEDYLVSKNDFGENVHQIVFNAQFLPQAGQGWIRLLEFLPDGKTVHVRTYSPYLDEDGDPATAGWRTGAVDDFSFELGS